MGAQARGTALHAIAPNRLNPGSFTAFRSQSVHESGQIVIWNRHASAIDKSSTAPIAGAFVEA